MQRVARFSTLRPLLNAKPAVKVSNSEYLKQKSSTTFDKNFPVHRRQKAWEKDGEDKDFWFRRKYAHVHARSKPTEDKYGARDAWKSKIKDEERRQRADRREHKAKYASAGLKPNPLMEYVYGTSSVTAALKANKRDYFSRLLVLNEADPLCKLAKERGCQIEVVDKHRMNILTNNGVHNGYVLETKPLQPKEIRCVNDVLDGQLSYQETFFDQYKTAVAPFTTTEKKRNPLGLYIDEVQDPHNIGAIIRSCHFLGVDFVVLSERNCAPLSPVVSKTSAGALEYMPIMTTDKPLRFFDESRQNGWMFISASLPDGKVHTKSMQFGDLSGLLETSPVVLVVGNEGKGIRTNLKMRSDFLVEIPGVSETSVDSLNVSVATSLLVGKLVSL